MTRDDYQNFCTCWKMAYQMVNAKEPAGEVLDATFHLLEKIPFSMVQKAIEHHLTVSAFAIKPVDVFNFIRQATEQSTPDLEIKASKFFDAHLANVCNNLDTVIEDPHFAYAFETCFGDMNTYFNLPANDFAISQSKKIFVKAVLSSVQMNLINVNHVFKGRRNFKDLIQVQFFGEYEKCKVLADNYYLGRPEFKSYKIEYPKSPSVRLENKQAKNQISEQDKQNNLILLDNVIKKLTQTQ